MKHLLNICNINGAEVEPVDIITFGAPCQDLSVAGKRMGLKHSAMGDEETTRSGLFYEAIRIIKEMREATNNEYPKYAVYENVPGAFSSNKGRDFHAVLEAICSVCDDTVSIPKPYDKKRTKLVWNKAGEVVGNNYSVAWRTLDAQYWGVPQRRKRIYLVADFTGGRAGEILFKPDSLRGDLQTGDEAGQEVTADAVGGVDGSSGNGGQLAATVISSYGTKWNGNAGAYNGENFVLQKPSIDRSVGNGLTVFSFDSLSSNSMKSSNPFSGCRAVEIAKCIDTTYPDPSKNQGGVAVVQPLILKERAGCEGGGKGALWSDKAFTLATNQDMSVCAMATQQGGAEIAENLCPTITAAAGMSGNNQPVIALQANGIDRADTAGCNGCGWRENESYTLNTIDRHAVCYPLNEQIILRHGALGRNTGFGAGEDGDPAYTLQANHPHAVCFENHQHGGYKEGCGTLRACGGDYGGGSENICVQDTYQTKTDPLMANSHPGSYTGQDAYSDMLVAGKAPKPPRKYIIRRLTPTECARLQGFPDNWGHLAPYDPADAEFWEDVRKTHAEINGKKYKPVKDLKKWYDKLHTDSAEYKAYGNGLALPCAEFVIRGIAEVLRNEKGQFASKGGVIEHKGYTCIYKPEHPRAKANGYVREHILVAEEMLGRPLDGEEVVHHINGDKADNRPENLEIFPNHAEHVRHHNRTDGKKYSYNGGEFTVAELSEFSVVDYSVLTQRINKLGWDIKRAVETPKRGQPTLGSLFDGIGGFPLAGALNGINPLWASEIEPYPIAVTKSRFKEVHNG